jgi:radical SAM/Cys-rich protein
MVSEIPLPTIPPLPLAGAAPFTARLGRPLRAAPSITTLQVNVGYVCNLACRHCHVESSPARTAPDDNMDETTARRVVEWALAHDEITTVDLTGGSPEMNPSFRWMVETIAASGRKVMDRCNPTIIEHVDRATGAGYEWLPKFLARHEVEVVASMPCYLEENVDRQRGRGAYEDSVEGLRRLNGVGYGREERLVLDLVYNPGGPHLPPPQARLEADYRRELRARFGIEFTALFTITNMPIKRWRHELEREGRLEGYMSLLAGAFNAATVGALMCRRMISVDPRGRIYDCDFNQAIGLETPGSRGRYLWDFTARDLAGRAIATGDHCFGCTAGAGSSCGGALA